MPGSRQIAAALAIAAKPRKPSKLAELLARCLVMNILSPQLVQEIAEVALLDLETSKDHDCTKDIRKLSTVGSHGKFPQNCRRQLFNTVLAAPKLESQSFLIPLKDNDSETGWSWTPQDLFLPHLWLHQMWLTTNTCGKQLCALPSK